ncbi:MAG: Gfo/Idh/MocA family oxidoreductase [Bacteroidales bacterium]|jgi:predicted dehydrogenase|nr:Gfo/Idh/MocA family oxidoreductase [Bacteroidales bacterium]
MNEVKWGIIGCGNVTEVKSGPAFNKIPNSSLVAVMRRDGEKAKDYAKRHQVPKWYSKAEDLINDPDVNAVYVATPPGSHATLAIKALSAGKPVYVEKPMALNHAECLQMIEASKKYKVPLFVAYYRRALSGLQKVKELLDSDAIGKVKSAHIQLYKPLSTNEMSDSKPWRVNPKIAGGGHFVDLASHQLDLMDYLFGPVTEVRSLVKNQGAFYQAEDIVSASFLFRENIIVSGNWCFTVPEFLRRDTVEIIGTKGSLLFSSFGYTPIELKTAAEVKVIDFPTPEHVQQELITSIVEELRGNGQSSSNGESGARTSKVMDQVLADYYKS